MRGLGRGSRDAARSARRSSTDGGGSRSARRSSTDGGGSRSATDSRLARRRAAALIAVAGVLLLAGCSADPLAEQYRAGSGKGFVAGDGTYVEIPPEQRGEPIDFSGETVEGETFDSGAHDGEVLVVNFWYASCAPCRAEAPILQDASARFADEEVTLVGVNVRDQAGTASSFEEKYGIGYASILDVDSGLTQLAFATDVPPNAVPTTLVLDREHRVAARLLGQIQDASIIESMVQTVVDEDA